MSYFGSPHNSIIDEALLRLLTELDRAAAWTQLLAYVDQQGISFTEAANALVEAAFVSAEVEPQKATEWLEVAQALYTQSPQTATEAQIAQMQAKIAQVQARLYLQQGQLIAAEQSLRHSQSLWRSLGNSTAVARTYLGLTQILALQGNYVAAQVASDGAITELEATLAAAPESTQLFITALRNQANLYGHLHNHQAALAAYERALQALAQHRLLTQDVETVQQLDYEEACIAVSRSVDLMALARLQDAEEALQEAISHFSLIGNKLYGSRAQSNLASLYAHSGQYMRALSTFGQATETLWGTSIELDTLPIEELYRADVLLLDQAMVFLALNLQREARHTLSLAEGLFIHAQRPYELAQTLYARGLLLIQDRDWMAATQLLSQAATIFTDLHNQYWYKRTVLANALLLQQQGQSTDALALVASLIEGDPLNLEEQWYGWDLGTATELYLLQLQLFLQINTPDAARQSAAIVAQLFHRHFTDLPSPTIPSEAAFDATPSAEGIDLLVVPHLRFAYLYALGRIEQKIGDLLTARGYFAQAVRLLEAQRVSFPLEEIRIAFLADKITIYTDWLLSLVDVPDMTDIEIAEAFAVVERARSRALLERLLTTLDDVPTDGRQDEPPHLVADGQQTKLEDSPTGKEDLISQRNLARQHLHWLYNQLIGQEGARRLQTEELQMLRQLEFRLEQLESSTHLPLTATPVDLYMLQAVLQPNELVLAYYIAGDEVLLFAITATEIQLFRRLCSLLELRKAQRDLQFQLGRASSGNISLHNLDARSQRLLQQSLQHFYQLLVAPLEPLIQGKELKIIPHGLLHQLPFHAFWTGKCYLIEAVNCCYTLSASIAVHQAMRIGQMAPMRTWSGLAVTDQGIPETEAEVKLAAHFFPQPQLYIGAAANRAGLAKAAQEADILHISTHGLMRTDNPLFSSLKLADGWIDVREIYQLELRAQLVILSACRSGSSQIEQGDEVMGLVRGFLGAGVQSLLVSQWDVDDTYAPHFMENFYQYLTQSHLLPVAALRAAQCQAIAAGHHPYWWAPFFIIG